MNTTLSLSLSLSSFLPVLVSIVEYKRQMDGRERERARESSKTPHTHKVGQKWKQRKAKRYYDRRQVETTRSSALNAFIYMDRKPLSLSLSLCLFWSHSACKSLSLSTVCVEKDVHENRIRNLEIDFISRRFYWGLTVEYPRTGVSLYVKLN